MRYQPVETSYNGEIFKSKSEAILARSFDLCAKITHSFIWEYEPERLGFNNYIPDFNVVFRTNAKVIYCFIIEYKPRKPSESYLKKFIQYDEYIMSLKFPFITTPMIVYGSMYDDEPNLRSMIYYHEKEGEKDFWEDTKFTVFGANTIPEAKTYRFDLCPI